MVKNLNTQRYSQWFPTSVAIKAGSNFQQWGRRKCLHSHNHIFPIRNLCNMFCSTHCDHSSWNTHARTHAHARTHTNGQWNYCFLLSSQWLKKQQSCPCTHFNDKYSIIQSIQQRVASEPESKDNGWDVDDDGGGGSGDDDSADLLLW